MSEQLECYAYDKEGNDVPVCCYCYEIDCSGDCLGDWPNLEDIKEVKDDE